MGREDLLKANEVFLTNTNVQVLPVSHAGQTTIGTGKAGPVTLEIINTFRQTLAEILE
jgi:branched-chain amino acid aminotransferase